MAKKRKAGDGLIRQRTDGRWEGRYVVGYDDHGYPKTKAVFGKSKRECAEKLAALGVRGILNFTNVELDLAHTSTAVQNVHIGDSLMQLTYKMRAGTALHEDEDGKEE